MNRRLTRMSTLLAVAFTIAVVAAHIPRLPELSSAMPVVRTVQADAMPGPADPRMPAGFAQADVLVPVDPWMPAG